MTPREQLYYLLEHYYKGDYRTADFASQFSYIYDLECGEDDLTAFERPLFRQLSKISYRYSPYESDHINYPSVYYTEDDVRKTAADVYLKVLEHNKE